MANMSYCRFRNTDADLNDCLDALAEGDALSVEEVRAGKHMFISFLEFCKGNYIIGDFDEENINSMFCSLLEDEDEDD